MARAKTVHDFGVILGALIGVVDDQSDRGTGGLAFEDPREDLYLIGLLPLGCVARSTGFATVKIGLQISRCQLQAGRTTIDDTANCRPMTLTKEVTVNSFPMVFPDIFAQAWLWFAYCQPPPPTGSGWPDWVISTRY